MKELLYDGSPIKLSKMLEQYMPELTYGYFKKLLYAKDIKINDKRVNTDVIVNPFDLVKIYAKEDKLKKNTLHIVYYDDKILIVNKPIGKLSQGIASIEDNVKETFPSAILCHRLDTNTSGLLIFALETVYEQLIIDAIKSHRIIKNYYALVCGLFDKSNDGDFLAYLSKNSEEGKVFIIDSPRENYQKITTTLKLIKNFKNTSLLDVTLLSGKTHQIRAHLSYIGYPIVGDCKYGDFEYNKAQKIKFQQLQAYSITFRFEKESKLFYLNNTKFELPNALILPTE